MAIPDTSQDRTQAEVYFKTAVLYITSLVAAGHLGSLLRFSYEDHIINLFTIAICPLYPVIRLARRVFAVLISQLQRSQCERGDWMFVFCAMLGFRAQVPITRHG